MRKKKSKKKKIALSIIGAIIAVFAIILIISNNILTVDSYSLSYNNLPKEFDGFKIVQLSDLHNKKFGRDNSRLLKAIDEQKPDIVVMTGDMVNKNDVNYTNFIFLAKKLTEKYSVYYVIGNHEVRLKNNNLNRLYNELKKAKVTVLDNEKVSLKRDGASIDLYGMWYGTRYYKDLSKKEIRKNYNKYYFSIDKMNKVMGKRDSSRFSILITHNPLYFDTYAKWGTDLTLCGHLHGGIIRLPFIGGVLVPNVPGMPRYDAGLYTEDNKNMIISRGLGNGNIAPRFLDCPDIVTITLHSNK